MADQCADPAACAGLVQYVTGEGLRGDPQCHMSDKVAAIIDIGAFGGWDLRPAPGRGWCVDDIIAGTADLTGATLRIANTEGALIYRFVSRCAHGDWLLRWPD